MKDKIGVIHGRFQGLHWGHMEYLLAGMKRCEHLFIGITNFDIMEEKPLNEANPTRASAESNPFSYYHRYMMIKNSLIEYGVSINQFDIVPFPIEYPDKIKNYVPVNAKFYVTIYDQWGEKKLSILNSLGYNTEVMWYRTNAERFSSGTQVRDAIRSGAEWKHLVPNAVYNYIIENDLISIIKGVKS